MTLDPVAPPRLRPPRPPRWPYALVASFFATGLAVVLLWPVKLPYYAMSPGPVEDVSDLITVSDAPTYQSEGTFYLLTVGLREVNAFEWFEARFLDSRVDLLEREVVRPPGVTQEQVTRSNIDAMNESIDSAIFVALERLGYDVSFVGEGVEVLQVVDGSPAMGVIQVGDRFDVIAGQHVSTVDEATAIIRSHAVGDTIRLEGTRGEAPLAVEVTLAPHTEIADAPMIGVALATVNLALDLPIAVEIDSGDIGGPSAGVTFALSLYDLLTPGDLTKGHVIAATGTIRFDETVGPIGGVRQKVFAARAVGAEIVFVPDDNYRDALTAAGDGIVIVAVTNLQEALDYLEALEPAPALVASG